jgi:hypothetical protein
MRAIRTTNGRTNVIAILVLYLANTVVCITANARESVVAELPIAVGGEIKAVVVVSPQAGNFEKRAAADLAKYIGMMCGAEPPIANSQVLIDAAMAGTRPVLVVGQQAFEARPKLRATLNGVLKKNPHLRTDGIVLVREGNRVYIAGNNDRSHYFAVAELLRRWGCRWYLPTEFGECIPQLPDLAIGELNHAYSSPFEIRTYWISWIGDTTGAEDFRLRNMMTDRSAMPPTGHALGKHTKGLGTGTFNFPITAQATAEHVAGRVERQYRDGEAFSLGMEDGSYDSEDPNDQKLMKLQWDKYFMRWSVTDPMLELYNNVARILQEKHPDSNGKIGFLAYANMTIPPRREMVAERSLYCELAPIDIDPIHGMDDPESPPRREYRDMMYKWARVMQGRLCIYDYDQGMLVWRDIPNPSHQAFQQDVKHYQNAGILGVNTESRNAMATTFLNLHIRGRLLWRPNEQVDQLLDEFYPKFYGPAAEPMKAYWSTIYDAWENTVCTEHEYFIAPAIYTPQVMAVLKKKMNEAEQITNGIKVQGRKLTRSEQMFVDRVNFTRISFDIIDAYTQMITAAATHVDYREAVKAGERGLQARDAMTALGGIFTTTKLERNGTPWWPGEVQQYRDLHRLVNGREGKMLIVLPLRWAFRRDPKGQGLAERLSLGPPNLDYWNAHQEKLTTTNRKDYPDEWELIRTDLYAQAQGIRLADRQSYTGHMWYHTELQLTDDQVGGSTHLLFPGLFNECWLYINGRQVAHRKQGKIWWLNDYRFEWDVDLAGKLRTGKNDIALRCHCEHHFGGMFRRPFLYQKVGK